MIHLEKGSYKGSACTGLGIGGRDYTVINAKASCDAVALYTAAMPDNFSSAYASRSEGSILCPPVPGKFIILYIYIYIYIYQYLYLYL